MLISSLLFIPIIGVLMIYIRTYLPHYTLPQFDNGKNDHGVWLNNKRIYEEEPLSNILYENEFGELVRLDPYNKDRKIALGVTIINLIISLVVYISYDSSSILFQFVQDNYDTSFFNIYLGVDGISIYFVVRPLICYEPGQLRPITGPMLYKPTNLPNNERNWGVEHVSKAWNGSKYNFFKGKVIFIHASPILSSQDWILASKILDTKCCCRYIKMQSVYLGLQQLIWNTFPKQGAKDRISDSKQGIGDPLSLVIDTSIFKILALRISKGDGVIVVPIREGSQESSFSMSRTGVRSLIHSTPLLKTNAFNYSKMTAYPSNNFISSKRFVSSQPLTQIGIYKKAYDIIKSNPGNMTPGTDGRTLDGMSIKKLEVLMENVKKWEYECKPTKRVYIKKANGKLRPLGIPSTMDKILQMAIKMIIEPVCEDQIFNSNSYGFRPNRSLHHALNAVRGMVGITWMIEGDIKGYFDNIDHNKLNQLIKDKLNPDRTMFGIFQKMFKAGYLEENRLKHSILGVPQGGIISPILSNLYLTPLDEFMEKLKEKYVSAPVSTPNKEYRIVEARIYTLRRKLSRWSKNSDLALKNDSKREFVISELKKLKTKLRTLNSRRRVGNRVHYVRYADDWVVGIVGTKKFAEEIKNEIKIFLNKELKLKLSEEKTKITHLGTQYAKFLGHYIRAATLRQHIATRRRSKDGQYQNIRKSTSKPKILVPINDLKEKLIQKGFANVEGKPKYIGKFIGLSDYEIINRYNYVLRGLMTFYNMSENRSRLGELIYIIEFSLANTLGAKHKLSLAKVFQKYGKPFRTNSKGKVIIFDKPESLRAEYLNKKYTVISPLSKAQNADPFSVLNWDIKETNILDQPCFICKSNTQVEMHHLRHLKDTKDKSTLIKIMSKINRKMIPLCRPCHMEVHRGKYDGVSLKDLRDMQKVC